MAVRNQIRDELLVDGVGVPLRLHRELSGDEEVRRHVAHGEPRPAVDHGIDRVPEIGESDPVRAGIQKMVEGACFVSDP